MVRVGEPPYLECSSHGDRRFSAFHARIAGRGHLTIEVIYQGAKVFEGGRTGLSWREAKGKRATNQSEVASLYSALWDEYIDENPQLVVVLRGATGLSDMFGETGHVCQALELWRIREERR